MSRATDIEKAQCCSDGFLHRFCLNKPCDGLKTRQAGIAKHLVDLDKRFRHRLAVESDLAQRDLDVHRALPAVALTAFEGRRSVDGTPSLRWR